MTKYEWERQLKKGISGLPQGEQQRVLDYYNELFADKIDAHMREQDIIAEFGNPYDVANKILVDFYNDGRENQAADSYVYSTPDVIDEAFDEQKPTENVYKSRRAGERTEETVETVPTVEEKTAKTRGKTRRANKKENATKSVAGLISIIGVLLFFILGACFNLWHPAWMIFLFIPVAISLVDAVEKHNWKRFNYPVFIVLMYMFLGFACGLWHPMWILFITVPIYYIAGSFISKNIAKDDDTEKDYPIAEEKDSRSFKPDTEAAEVTEKKRKRSAGRIVAGVFLTIALIYVSIVVWTAVIGMFVAGIGMITGGVAALIVAVVKLSVSFNAAMVILGGSLIVLGLGFVFTFGFASLFKHCARMCRGFNKTIRKCFGKKEAEAL